MNPETSEWPKDEEYDCPECIKEDVEVAPGIYQSKEDYEANAAYDAAHGN